MENQPDQKPPKPFASIAQLERCRGLVAEGKMTQARFDVCYAITDVPNLPERLHPKKETKQEQEPKAI